MKLEGTVEIDAPREKVFASLIDPNLVSQCAPGLQSMEIVEPEHKFKVVVGLGFGAVMVTFNVDIEFLELRKPELASMKAHGNAPGSAVDVISEMRLSELDPQRTELAWTADVVVLGSIASLAQRMMGGITKKLSGNFFDCIKEKIEVKESVKA